MECAGPQAVDVGALQFSPYAPHHFRRGIVGIGERKNFVGPGVTFADEAGHALREHGGFPRPRAGNHQHRPMNMPDGLPLPFIGDDLRRRWQSQSLRSHWPENIRGWSECSGAMPGVQDINHIVDPERSEDLYCTKLWAEGSFASLRMTTKLSRE